MNVNDKIRFDKGLCVACKQPRIKTSRYCLYHAVYNIVKFYDIENKPIFTKELQTKLELQQFKCYYTGVTIFPTVNASVDHMIPVALGGETILSNLVWCESSINRLKNGKTAQEFIIQYADHIKEFKTLNTLSGIHATNYLLNK